jgi:hypothetical protein
MRIAGLTLSVTYFEKVNALGMHNPVIFAIFCNLVNCVPDAITAQMNEEFTANCFERGTVAEDFHTYM